MTNSMAFTGTLTAVKHLKTSGDLQFVITVPKQMANEALRRAGGFPDPAQSRWMAVAVLDTQADASATSLPANRATEHEGGAASETAVERDAANLTGEG